MPSHLSRLKQYLRLNQQAYTLLILWTLAIIFVSYLFMQRQSDEFYESVRIEVRAYFNSLYTFRGWVAEHGGLYAPITEQTPPNPHLKGLKERELTTPSGRRLTLINPAYMTRQVKEKLEQELRIIGRLTSLRPVNQANDPDPWERAALESFEDGITEVGEVSDIDGEPYMRLIKPLPVDPTCLKCHAKDGYKVGDIRGGLSVAVPMSQHVALFNIQRRETLLIYTAAWLLGVITILLVNFLSSRYAYRLQESNRRLKESQDIANVGTWEWDISSDKLYWSDKIYEIFGIDDHETVPSYALLLTFVHPNDRPLMEQAVSAALEEDAPYSLDHRIITTQGEEKVVHERGRVMRDDSGRPMRMIGTVQDITVRKQQEMQLKLYGSAERLVGLILNESLRARSMDDYLNRALQLICHDEGLNPSRGMIFTIDSDRPDELVRRATVNFAPEQLPACERIAMGECVCGRVAESRRAIYVRSDDDRHSGPFSVSEPHAHYCSPIVHGDKLLGVLNLYLDYEHNQSESEMALMQRLADVLSAGMARLYAERQIEYQAYHNPLTGLPNRRLLLDRLQRENGLSLRQGNFGALLYVDIDQFKKINEAMGHESGDYIAREVAEGLGQLLGLADTLAHITIDEFVLLLPSLGKREEEAVHQAHKMVQRIREQIAATRDMSGNPISLSASIGIVIFPDLDSDAEELLKRADTAMHQAKREGRNLSIFFDHAMQHRAETSYAMENAIRIALENREFALYYQPQVDASGQIIGAEALIRWPRPDGGMTSPGAFIPVAEESELILPLGEWITRQAVSDIRRVMELQPPHLQHISINISPLQFKQADFVDDLSALITESGIRPQLLHIEITEGLLLQDIDAMVAKMNTVRDLGINFSIDDFGTGYSSLSYLNRLPIEMLKIDQSFVRGISNNESDREIVNTIISMAHHLDMQVIAEGVETREELEFLTERGCGLFQGYYFHKPLPAEEFFALLGEQPVS